MIQTSYVEEHRILSFKYSQFRTHTLWKHTHDLFWGPSMSVPGRHSYQQEDKTVAVVQLMRNIEIFKIKSASSIHKSYQTEVIKTKSWDYLIFKTCILHSFVSRSRVFIESSTWKFQIKSSPLCKSYFNSLQF